MTRKSLFGGSAALALAVSAVALATPALAQSAAAADSKPQLGDWGVDVQGMDLSVKPGEDFYKFVNGQWDAKTEIPADRSSWGGFAVLRDLSDQRTRAIIEESAKQNAPAGTVAQKVGDFYASFMDEAAIEARGMEPVKPMLAKIDGLTSRDDLARALAENVKLGLGSPVEIGVELDLKDNSKYGVYVGQGGLGMPNRDYYLVDNDRFKATRVKYKTYIAETLKLAGFANAEARAEAIYALEEKIAKGHWTSAESRQIDKLYNPVATAALDKDYAGLGWSTYLQTAGLAGQPQVIVTQPSAIKAALALVANEPMDVWKDYLRFHTVKAASPMLSKAFVDLNFGWRRPCQARPS